MEFVEGSAGKVIRNLRVRKGLTQEVLSGLAGMARSHLAMIESVAKAPNFETLCRLASALDLPPHALVLKIEEEFAKYDSSR